MGVKETENGMGAVFHRIKELHMEKRRPFLILLIVETFLLIAGIAALFGKDAVYEYGREAMTCNFGTFSEEYQGVVADGEKGMTGNMVEFTGITLPKGTYRIQLSYVTDTDWNNQVHVTDESLSMTSIRTNGVSLYQGLNHTDFDMWLLRDSDQVTVYAYYDGEGFLAVQGLRICRTNAWNRMLLFIMVCLFTVINVVCLYWGYDKKYSIPVKSKTVTFCLGLIILFASLPMTLDYVTGGGDLLYHLMRVEGIRDGLANGQFPIRISPEWQQGYGYASPIFYGETLLYPAALFRLVGFSVTTSCRMFMFGIVTATVLIAYYCFKKIFGEPYIGVFCSMLYSLSVYRIYKTYHCGSWGECFGIMLLPFFAYGFYRVFTQDIHEESYKRSWVPLTIGFSLVVQSHLLTGEMVGLFTIILCVIFWKKVIRPKTFIVLAKTVVYSVLLSAWFLVPFVDYMTTGDFVIHHVSGRTIQDRGVYPAHLLFTYFISGESVFFDETDMYDSAPMGIGIVLITALVLFVYLLFAGKTGGLSKEEKKLGVVGSVFSIAAMVMSLNLFPWDRIQSWNGITATLVSSIQFPNRFLTIANIGLTAVAGVMLQYFMKRKNKAVTACYVGGMILLLGCGSIHLLEYSLNHWEPIRIYNSEGMGTGYIAGSEYLPFGVDPWKFVYHDPVCTGDLEATDYKKLSLGAEAHLSNNGEDAESASYALLYYKGYRAFDTDSGEELKCYPGENCEVEVEVPAGFDGNVRVEFDSPVYWRVGEIVTVLTLLCMSISFCRQRRREV